MQDTLSRPLNLEEEVTPNHWSVERFDKFSRMSIDEEFDAIAPLFIYFEADCALKAPASKAANRLLKVDHPLLDGWSVAEVMSTTRTPAGLQARYTALMMALADDVIPGIDSYIDRWGAYSFRVLGDDTVLAGDAPGTFAYYMSAALVRQRLRKAQQLAT